MKVFCSWSGGKESCLACYKAIQEGHEVASLLTMVTTTGDYTRSHRLSRELLIAQSQVLGIPLYQRRASWNTYEKEFIGALTALKREGIEGGVFGDLRLDEHREWVERVCAAAGIIPMLPLWGAGYLDLLRQFLGVGFEAIIVAMRSDMMDVDWLGKRLDEASIAYMEDNGIDLCGEGGEYHSLVVDGPLFRERIAIGETLITRRGNISFLKVLSFALKKKNEQ
jgi:diphthine-ammonia ligase